ncbi:MAG: valine--tRNA ligase [Myxococcota bacterium]|nr:valine--tRNA ligase [Myxococcota bacterium]MEE2778934.1 valine--tRNA ligase [Myxococcota bacterium]
MTEMSKAYEHEAVEQRWYPIWEERGYFHAQDVSDAPPFCIMIPPPNVTGSLHIGHALSYTIEDILTRWRRMQGYNTLWLPGTDHAGIATQMVVERELAKDGISRFDLGREKFLEKVWEWKDIYHARVTEQLKVLGFSVDWARERFTMDDGLSLAVRRVFVDLYNDGLLYRAKRLVNWSPGIQTVLSDLEVEHKELPGHLWHIAYPVTGSDERLVVATTRPETMLGDTAVAVHPEDPRYKHLIGQTIDLPLTDRKIPIIADDILVNMEFGSGAVKVTPAHDPNDFETGKRHDLEMINILDDHARLNENAPSAYQGMDRFDARAKLVSDLDAQGLLVEVEDHTHSVGHCQRTGVAVEPMLSDQWFVKIQPLAEPAIQAVKEGKTTFVSPEWEKVYFNWMDNIRDWCVSRQLWWGHQIPAWYCDSCSEIHVSMEGPSQCSSCGSTDLTQDSDVLDTWFSSGLWPFSTLGWPEKTDALKTFYPGAVMETGFDIIFFWVARMMMMGIRCMGEVPFHTIYLHGMVRDEHGQKMSKTKGNVIDPLDVTKEHGADALRMTLAALAAQARDVKLSHDRLAGYRNFANKLWNASRFVLMNIPEGHVPATLDLDKLEDLSVGDRWVLHKLDHTIEEVTSALENYRLDEASMGVYDFIWHTYCDWTIELSKTALRSEGSEGERTREVLLYVLDQALRLLHPMMPFVTEEIWTRLPLGERETDSVMVASWPVVDPRRRDDRNARMMDQVIAVISAVRNIQGENRISPKAPLAVVISTPDTEATELVLAARGDLAHLANVTELSAEVGAQRPPKSAVAVAGDCTVYVPLEGLVDLEEEVSRLERAMGKLDGEITKLEKKLSNERFLANAPPEVVEADRTRLSEAKSKRSTYAESVAHLSG